MTPGWPRMTLQRSLIKSCIFVTDQKFHIWPPTTWSWEIWRDCMCIDEIRSISIFSHCPTTGRWQNWPDLRSLSKFQDIQIVPIIILMNFCESQIHRIRTVARAWPQSFLEVRSLTVPWWPDLTWPYVEIFRKGAEWMIKQLCQRLCPNGTVPLHLLVVCVWFRCFVMLVLSLADNSNAYNIGLATTWPMKVKVFLITLSVLLCNSVL